MGSQTRYAYSIAILLQFCARHYNFLFTPSAEKGQTVPYQDLEAILLTAILTISIMSNLFSEAKLIIIHQQHQIQTPIF